MKKIFFALVGFLLSVCANTAFGAGIAHVVGVAPAIGAVALNGVAVASSLVGGIKPADALCAGIYTEVWTGEMVKAFRNAAESLGWYNRIRSYDQYVENDVIHFVNLGGDPNVLVNNTTYPLNVQTLEDGDKAVSLDLYETEATAVSDNELYAISYDKMSSVIERHKDAINEKRYAKAIHAVAPATNTDTTPVLLTSGEAVDGRKAMTRKDIIALKRKFDKMKVPLTGRILRCVPITCPTCSNSIRSSPSSTTIICRARFPTCTVSRSTSTSMHRITPYRPRPKRHSVQSLPMRWRRHLWHITSAA